MSVEPLCFVTMVRGDHAMLKKWIAHHETLVSSRRALHIFIHGEDSELQDIAAGCSTVVLPFDETGAGFENARRNLFFGLAGCLRGYYRHVITLDCDEFMLLDPSHGSSFSEYLDSHPFEGAALSPVGFDVIQRRSAETAPVDFSKPILGQRRYGFLDGVYSKPCIFRRRPNGGTQHSLKGEAWEIDPKIFLFHFRFFDIEYSRNVNRSRMELVATFDQHGADHAIGTWGDRERRFEHALRSVEEAEPTELSQTAIEDFRASQLHNYKQRGGRLMWRDSRRGPFRIPKKLEEAL